jgi:hypothetical protein
MQTNNQEEQIMESTAAHLVGLKATTQHGERVLVIGSAHDPARIRVQPINDLGDVKVNAEWFTPRIADLTFDARSYGPPMAVCPNAGAFPDWHRS